MRLVVSNGGTPGMLLAPQFWRVMMMIPRSFRPVLTAVITGFFLLATGCGGGGGGGSDGDDGFPTPTLPAGALKFDGTNANAIATTAVSFLGTLDTVAELRTEAPPSVADTLKLVTDHVVKWNRVSSSVAAKTENISAGICVSGTAIANFEETASSASGTVTFTDCDIGSGIVINGSFVYDTSWNDTTLAYSFHIGGTLSVAVSGETITIVMNLTESGNDGTGDFSGTASFSLSGIPGGGFLVTTTQPWTGNALPPPQVTDGELIVYGGDNTRLRITVTGINAADVDLDNGSGTFVFDSTIMF